ncbi:MAG TPA: histone deacetylase family protein [Syntrophobacteraceae bacterium]|mgnify:CR=1 FL=1|nr:histone deacetylase family protein [Syntrophobacteraceae bacterium]
MKIITHSDFRQVYVSDPAAAPGRIEAILDAIGDEVTLEEAIPAGWDDIEAVHTARHIENVTRRGLYSISALAAGAAIQAATLGLEEPSFALVRPPGHHASADSSWGFCYFNNMAVALDHLRRAKRITKAYVLDFDLHFGDGTVNILEPKGYVTIHNPEDDDRESYLKEVELSLQRAQMDIIGVSAGFDNHRLDWGGLLNTEDYQVMGYLVHETAVKRGIGCFGVLEGGYNHSVLGQNVRAFLRGLRGLKP